MVAIKSELVTVVVHALGVPTRLASVVLGTTIVRTNSPVVVSSSTYRGFVFALPE